MGKQHCFHQVDDGVTLPVGLNQLKVHERCCFCGMETVSTVAYEERPVSGHGPHYLIGEHFRLSMMNYHTGEPVGYCDKR